MVVQAFAVADSPWVVMSVATQLIAHAVMVVAVPHTFVAVAASGLVAAMAA